VDGVAGADRIDETGATWTSVDATGSSCGSDLSIVPFARRMAPSSEGMHRHG
jgi:hypothetical protein